jgi:hypothetical protein
MILRPVFDRYPPDIGYNLEFRVFLKTFSESKNLWVLDFEKFLNNFFG